MHTCTTNSMPPKAETQATEARRGASWLQLLAAAAAGAALCSSALLAHDAGRRPSMSIVDRELLAGSIFVGHLAPDMDSVAAAVASAELYVGTAAVASNLNRSRPSLPRPSVARAPHRLRPPKSHTLWVIRCPHHPAANRNGLCSTGRRHRPHWWTR